jgi:hypothetical protein
MVLIGSIQFYGWIWPSVVMHTPGLRWIDKIGIYVPPSYVFYLASD